MNRSLPLPAREGYTSYYQEKNLSTSNQKPLVTTTLQTVIYHHLPDHPTF